MKVKTAGDVFALASMSNCSPETQEQLMTQFCQGSTAMEALAAIRYFDDLCRMRVSAGGDVQSVVQQLYDACPKVSVWFTVKTDMPVSTMHNLYTIVGHETINASHSDNEIIRLAQCIMDLAFMARGIHRQPYLLWRDDLKNNSVNQTLCEIIRSSFEVDDES